MSVNDTQVGGAHYQGKIQHWDFVSKNGISYVEGCASKYLCRAFKKHKYNLFQRFFCRLVGVKLPTPIQDLEKAIHYIQKMIELYEEGVIQPRKSELVMTVSEFLASNVVPSSFLHIAFTTLSFWRTTTDLLSAISYIEWEIESLDIVLQT